METSLPTPICQGPMLIYQRVPFILEVDVGDPSPLISKTTLVAEMGDPLNGPSAQAAPWVGSIVLGIV